MTSIDFRSLFEIWITKYGVKALCWLLKALTSIPLNSFAMNWNTDQVFSYRRQTDLVQIPTALLQTVPAGTFLCSCSRHFIYILSAREKI